MRGGVAWTTRARRVSRSVTGRRGFVVVILMVSVFFDTSCSRGEIDCPPFPSSAHAELLRSVKKKYKLPDSMPLSVTSVSLVPGSCHGKVRLKSGDPSRPFHVDLHLSPDLRFLTAELLDTSLEPEHEERKRKEGLRTGLIQGNFPAKRPTDRTGNSHHLLRFPMSLLWRHGGHAQEGSPALARRDAVRLVFRHYPLPMHKWARPAADAAACVQEQGSGYFWQVHDYLFRSQSGLTPQNIHERIHSETAGFPGFDNEKFRRCIAEGRARAQVERDIAFGEENGVRGTPTIFVNEHPVTGGREQILTLIRQISQSTLHGPVAP